MKKTITILSFSLAIILSLSVGSIASAQPYGQGLYGLVQYGDETSLSIATSGNVTIANITPVTGGTLATGTSNVTVTSTDVKGFKLYVRSLTSTDMNNLGAIVPASGNGSPATLAVNTWGYNINGSANFTGTTLTDVLIKSLTTPASGNGSPTTLAVNTWGYNINGSANFTGMTLTDVLIKSLTTPASSGDVTTFTYGINIDLSKPAGNYSTSVVYTAVPQTD